jgi:hypothetical protein
MLPLYCREQNSLTLDRVGDGVHTVPGVRLI